MKRIITSIAFLLAFAFPLSGMAQSHRAITVGDKIELFGTKLNSCHVFQQVRYKTSATIGDMKMFMQFYADKIATDKGAFGLQVMKGTIGTDADVQNYAKAKVNEYVALFNSFYIMKSSVTGSYSTSRVAPPSTTATCNPSCDNIDFENGTLSAWTACYAQNTSTSSGFTTTTPTCSGTLGAVTTAAADPGTGTNQVSVTSGPGFDPIAGSYLPVVCPTGGSYSAMIGDGTTPNQGVAMLKQSFHVSAANPYLTFMYAVVLENPAHTYSQQPHFNVALLDSIGDTIGNYLTVSGPGHPGFKAFFYAPNGDTVYVKGWTTVSVSMKKYMGTCVTLIATSYDCALGGHFGYAYFDATCAPVGITASSQSVCGGNITLTAPGSGATSYKWTGPCIVGSDSGSSAIVSCGGIYRVIIDGNFGIKGAIDTLYDTIGSGSSISIKLDTTTNVSCKGGNNGTAVVSVTGGKMPYTYKWFPLGGTKDTATGLIAGPYTVTVTDSAGCSKDTTFTITQPANALVVTPSSVNASCGKNNGMTSVVVSGGITPYSYNWSPAGGTKDTAKGLSAGTYTCIVTDSNNCMVSASAAVSDTSTLVDSVKITNATCFGVCNGTAIAGQSGGTKPYTYSWSNGATTDTISGLCANNYTLTVTDSNGCSTLRPFAITQPTALKVLLDSSVGSGCSNSMWALVSGGTPPYTYMWSPGGQTSDTATALCGGTYTVTVTDADSCSVQAVGTLGIMTAINQVQSTGSVKMYPVPASNMLNINITDAGFTTQLVQVYDITGRKVLEQKVSNNNSVYSLDVTKLVNGTYILRISGNNGQKLARFTVLK